MIGRGAALGSIGDRQQRLDDVRVGVVVVGRKGEIAAEVARRAESGKKIPHLAAILVGDNGSSETYVNNKVKDCAEVGFRSTLIRLGNNTSEDELLGHIARLNEDDDVDGFIVQLPLPEHISENRSCHDGGRPVGTGS